MWKMKRKIYIMYEKSTFTRTYTQNKPIRGRGIMAWLVIRKMTCHFICYHTTLLLWHLPRDWTHMHHFHCSHFFFLIRFCCWVCILIGYGGAQKLANGMQMAQAMVEGMFLVCEREMWNDELTLIWHKQHLNGMLRYSFL